MTDIFPATAAKILEWQQQPDILGVLLVGSKSRGNDDEHSDDDLEVFFTDESFARFRPEDCGAWLVEGEGKGARMIYDAQYLPISDLKRKQNSPHDLDRWPYERARVLFDRNGDIAPAVAAAGRMDADFRLARLQYSTLNTWIAEARARKTFERGFDAAGRLIIARGAKSLERIMFALEWRWVPLDHWLEKELPTLRDEAQVGPLLLESLRNSDPAILQQALDTLEDTLAAQGVPRPAQRNDLFMQLIHPDRIEDAALHGVF